MVVGEKKAPQGRDSFEGRQRLMVVASPVGSQNNKSEQESEIRKFHWITAQLEWKRAVLGTRHSEREKIARAVLRDGSKRIVC